MREGNVNHIPSHRWLLEILTVSRLDPGELHRPECTASYVRHLGHRSPTQKFRDPLYVLRHACSPPPPSIANAVGKTTTSAAFDTPVGGFTEREKRSVSEALKGPNKSAQGNALGPRAEDRRSPERAKQWVAGT